MQSYGLMHQQRRGQLGLRCEAEAAAEAETPAAGCCCCVPHLCLRLYRLLTQQQQALREAGNLQAVVAAVAATVPSPQRSQRQTSQVLTLEQRKLKRELRAQQLTLIPSQSAPQCRRHRAPSLAAASPWRTMTRSQRQLHRRRPLAAVAVAALPRAFGTAS